MRNDNGTRAERTRAQLIKAAVAAFSAWGFHGTSTRNITDAAGLSSAALYVHHGSKEELLYEIATAGHEQILAIVREAVAGSDDPAEQLRALVRAYVLFHVRQHTMARVINYELAALSPEHRAEIAGMRRAIDHVIHDVVRHGAAQGRFDTPDPRMTAIVLESMGIDIARWYSERGDWGPEEIADGYVEMAIRLVGAS